MADIRMDGVYYSRSDMVNGEPKAGAKPWRILAIDIEGANFTVAATKGGDVSVFTKDGHYYSHCGPYVLDLIEYIAPQYVPFDNLLNEWEFGWMAKRIDGDWIVVPTVWSNDYVIICGISTNANELLREHLLSKDGGKTWQPCGKLKSPA